MRRIHVEDLDVVQKLHNTQLDTIELVEDLNILQDVLLNC